MDDKMSVPYQLVNNENLARCESSFNDFLVKNAISQEERLTLLESRTDRASYTKKRTDRVKKKDGSSYSTLVKCNRKTD